VDRAAFDAALQRNPDDVDAYAGRGLLALQTQDYARALDDFNAVIARRQKPADYCRRAEARAGLNGWQEALADWTQALAISPDSPEVYHSRGKAYFARGEGDHALANFQAMLTSKKTTPKIGGLALFHMALTYQVIYHDYPAAIASYSRSIERIPDEAVNYLNRGLLYFYGGDATKALDDTAKALEISRARATTRMAYNNRALFLIPSGDLDAAFASIAEGLKVDDSDYELYGTRALLHLLRGDLDAALRDAEHSHTLNADEPETLAGVAVVRCAMEQQDEAVRLWRLLIAQHPDYRDVEWLRREKHWFEIPLNLAQKIIAHL
jgi:tetratricopeptide (TPR) repeat protein